MTRYINADSIRYADLNSDMPTSNVRVWVTFKEWIDNTPTADVVEVVRCKDCKFGFDYYNDGDCYCKIPTREMVWLGNNWNGYCSHGERKAK